MARRAYGSGGLREINGAWYGWWRVGPAGRRRLVRRKLGPARRRGERDGLTRVEAERRLRDAMAATTDNARRRRPGDLTIAELCEAYLADARARGLKEATTLADYASATRNHLAPYYRDRPIRTIDSDAVAALARHLRTKPARGRRGRGRLAPKSVANYLGVLSALLRWAERRGLIERAPAMPELPRAGDARIERLRFLEPAEVEALLAAIDPRSPYADLDRCAYLLAARAGLRQGEARGLRWHDIDFGAAVLHVREGVTRGRSSSPKGRRRRAVPMAPSIAEALLTLRSRSRWTGADDPVLATPSTGRPMARTPMMERYRAALARAGLSADLDFHALRHTFGTTLARAVDVHTIKTWMGHADLSTTQLYMHYAPRARDAELIEAAFEPAGNKLGDILSAPDRTRTASRHLQPA